jgi:hypothetical protein
MHPEVVGALVNGAIPFFGGIYGTLLGHRIVGKPRGVDFKYDQWHERYGAMFRTLGPVLILFGLFLAISGIIRAS